MLFRNFLVFLFLAIGFSPVMAQVVDDTTSQIYGPHTTGIFYEKDLHLNNRIYYKKDSLYTFEVPIKVASPFLYAPKYPFQLIWQNQHMRVVPDTLNFDAPPATTPTQIDLEAKEKNDTAKVKEEPYHWRFYKYTYNYERPDTQIAYQHRYQMTYKNGQHDQNLGVLGTAMRPIFYQAPTEIGYQGGFHVYDKYATDPLKVAYFNSKSPFSRIQYLQGGSGESLAEIQFNRNVAQKWNFGFQYRRFTAEKQLAVSRPRDFVVLSQDFLFHVSHKSKNQRYQFLGNMTYFAHKVEEQGGVKLSRKGYQNPDSLYRYELSDTWLKVPASLAVNAQAINLAPYNTSNQIYSRERRLGYHFYHQYDLRPKGGLSVFHIFDRRNLRYRYEDPYIRGNVGSDTSGKYFYAKTYDDTATTYFNREIIYQQNSLGLKKTFKQFTAIAQVRHKATWMAQELSQIAFQDLFSTPSLNNYFIQDPKAQIKLQETFLGGEVKYRRGDSVWVHAKAEFLALFQNNSSSDVYDYKGIFKNNRDHLLQIEGFYKGWSAKLSRTQASPDMMSLFLQHNQYRWARPLNPTITHDLLLSKPFFFGTHGASIRGTQMLKPSLQLTDVRQHVYYDQNSIARQAGSDSGMQIIAADVQTHFHFGVIHWMGQIKATHREGPDLIRFPELFTSNLFYYDLKVKKYPNMHFMFGFDVMHRSAYNGYGYNPSIMQFKLEDRLSLPAATTVDFFINARLTNARLFFKVTQIQSFFSDQKGYMITPYYPAMRTSFQFGVNWFLYD